MNNLSQHHNENRFRVPDSYFDTLDDRITEVAFLESLKDKASGFQVPEDYFDKVEETILAKVKEQEPKVISLNSYTLFKYAAGIAAVVMIFVSVFQFSAADQPLSFETIDDTLISQYLEEDFFELSDSEFESYISLDKVEVSNAGLTDQEIFDYFSENMEGTELILGE